MQESEFNRLIDETLLRVEDAIDESGTDIDYDTISGILTLEFDDRSKVIINRQSAMNQLWVAARSGGFHLDFVEGEWYCKTQDCNFQQLLNRVCSEHAKQSIDLKL